MQQQPLAVAGVATLALRLSVGVGARARHAPSAAWRYFEAVGAAHACGCFALRRDRDARVLGTGLAVARARPSALRRHVRCGCARDALLPAARQAETVLDQLVGCFALHTREVEPRRRAEDRGEQKKCSAQSGGHAISVTSIRPTGPASLLPHWRGQDSHAARRHEPPRQPGGARHGGDEVLPGTWRSLSFVARDP